MKRLSRGWIAAALMLGSCYSVSIKSPDGATQVPADGTLDTEETVAIPQPLMGDKTLYEEATWCAQKYREAFDASGDYRVKLTGLRILEASALVTTGASATMSGLVKNSDAKTHWQYTGAVATAAATGILAYDSFRNYSEDQKDQARVARQRLVYLSNAAYLMSCGTDKKGRAVRAAQRARSAAITKMKAAKAQFQSDATKRSAAMSVGTDINSLQDGFDELLKSFDPAKASDRKAAADQANQKIGNTIDHFNNLAEVKANPTLQLDDAPIKGTVEEIGQSASTGQTPSDEPSAASCDSLPGNLPDGGSSQKPFAQLRDEAQAELVKCFHDEDSPAGAAISAAAGK